MQMDKVNNDVRELTRDEMDAVTGGIINGCLPQQTVPAGQPYAGWTFKDVFARHTLYN